MNCELQLTGSIVQYKNSLKHMRIEDISISQIKLWMGKQTKIPKPFLMIGIRIRTHHNK